MHRYVIAENIRRFQLLLQNETSPEKRRLLTELLHEEERKLAALDRAPAESNGS